MFVNYDTIYRRCKNCARHINGLVKVDNVIELSILMIFCQYKQPPSTKELAGLIHPIGMLIEYEPSILTTTNDNMCLCNYLF